MYFPNPYAAPYYAPMRSPYAPQYYAPMTQAAAPLPYGFFAQHAYRPQPAQYYAPQQPRRYAQPVHQPRYQQPIYPQYAYRPQPAAQYAYAYQQPIRYAQPEQQLRYQQPADLQHTPPRHTGYVPPPPAPQPRPAQQPTYQQPRQRAYAACPVPPQPSIAQPRPQLSLQAECVSRMLRSDVADDRAIIAALRDQYVISPQDVAFLRQEAEAAGRSLGVLNALDVRAQQAPRPVAPAYNVDVNAIAEAMLDPQSNENAIIAMLEVLERYCTDEVSYRLHLFRLIPHAIMGRKEGVRLFMFEKSRLNNVIARTQDPSLIKTTCERCMQWHKLAVGSGNYEAAAHVYAVIVALSQR